MKMEAQLSLRYPLIKIKSQNQEKSFVFTPKELFMDLNLRIGERKPNSKIKMESFPDMTFFRNTPPPFKISRSPANPTAPLCTTTPSPPTTEPDVMKKAELLV